MKRNPYKPFRDEEFLKETKTREIPITQRETRLLVLSLLEIEPEDIILDIGGGSGGIALEAARLAYNGQVYSIEKDLDAYQLIKENQKRLGIKNLKVIYGEAPKGLDLYNRMTFNRIFIGGATRQLEDVIIWCNNHLDQKGKIGATFNTLENCYRCIQDFRKFFDNIEIINLNISKSEIIHNLTRFKANNPVYIIIANKK